jgi:hypothetical protein
MLCECPFGTNRRPVTQGEYKVPIGLLLTVAGLRIADWSRFAEWISGVSEGRLQPEARPLSATAPTLAQTEVWEGSDGQRTGRNRVGTPPARGDA